MFVTNEKEIRSDLLEREARLDAMWANLLQDYIVATRKRLEVVHTFLQDPEAHKYRTMQEWVRTRLEDISVEATASHYRDVLFILKEQEVPLFTAIINDEKEKDAKDWVDTHKNAEVAVNTMSGKEILDALRDNPEAMQSLASRVSAKAPMKMKRKAA